MPAVEPTFCPKLKQNIGENRSWCAYRSVREAVPGEVPGLPERSAAVFALERLLARVDALQFEVYTRAPALSFLHEDSEKLGNSRFAPITTRGSARQCMR